MASTDVERGVVANQEQGDDVRGSEKFDQKQVLNLTIQNLSYKIVKKSEDGKSSEEVHLLRNVSATALAGQLLAVAGPSGAGKSTFLDAIAGRIDATSLEGVILVNNKPLDRSFKRLSGYVMQDDRLFPFLTVWETLMFSARLRLPGSMSWQEKKERVDMLIQELGLEGAATTIIGNEEVRGVSGGERRRVSIGVDLIHDPNVLFLDEPTSGLDSTSALSVIQKLHNIARQRQRTIILTIHQPSFRILELLDKLLILARGQTIYHGDYPGLARHFKEFGRTIPEHVNVLEYALDIVEEEQDGPEGLKPLVEFQEARGEKRKLSQLQSNLSLLSSGPKFATSFISETSVLADRNLKNILRTKELFGARIGLMVMMGLVLGSLFWNVGYDPKGVQSRASFFAFTLALFFFTSTEALSIFLDERQIFIRETSRGAYRASSYVISQAVVFLPFLFVLALIFSCISYWMIGLATSAGAFFFFVFVLFLTLAMGNSFVICWSAVVPNFITGNTIITALFAYFFLFSGFFIPRSDIPGYWIWLYYLSLFKYPLENLMWNEFTSSGVSDKCFGTNTEPGTACVTGMDILDQYDVGAVQKWANVGIMIGFFLVYRIIFYIALRIQSRATRK